MDIRIKAFDASAGSHEIITVSHAVIVTLKCVQTLKLKGEADRIITSGEAHDHPPPRFENKCVEMEGKEKENKHKNRLKSLFNKEKKTTTEDEVNDFLYGASDKLNFPAPSPTSVSPSPRLTRIDTTSARRWPTAAEVQTGRVLRGRSASPKRSRKGLVVRFANARPEIIGFGGDLEESPVTTISLRNRAQTHPSTSRERHSAENRDTRIPETGNGPAKENAGDSDAFRPPQIRRAQTGYESMAETRGTSDIKPTDSGRFGAEAHNETSFAARVKAERSAGEGHALVKAVSNTPMDELFIRAESPGPFTNDLNAQFDELQLNTMRNLHIPPSPGVRTQSIPRQTPEKKGSQTSVSDTAITKAHSNRRSSSSTAVVDNSNAVSRSITSTPKFESPIILSRSPTYNPRGAGIAIGDDATQEFASRTAHLFILFRLSTESVKPLSKCAPEEIVRVAAWWFLRGRLNLEATVRDRPFSPGTQTFFFARQQAYADLAKALWILEAVPTQPPESPEQRSVHDPKMLDIQDARQAIMSCLRKLTMSMKRNNFLPPEEAPLPQGLDSAIFTLEHGAKSILSTQKQNLSVRISDALPLGDSSLNFVYGRMFAEAVLFEGEAHQYRCPVLVSFLRSQKEKTLTAIITNQSGTLTILVQGDRARGPGWEDVVWQVNTNVMEITLPRGFLLRLQSTQQDFRNLLGIYEYQKKTYSFLQPHQDEEIIFDSALRTFQYFDQEMASAFPKEPLPHCQLRLFEKKSLERGAAGARSMHRGFRLGLVTSPMIKNLQGINQELVPSLPLQLGFLRGEGGLPALLMKIDDGKLRYTMVFTFESMLERTRIYGKLTGTALAEGELVLAETKVKIFSIASCSTEAKTTSWLKPLDWQNARVVNEGQANPECIKAALSENLRVVMDFKTGTLTDRVDTLPGELKLRLDVRCLNELQILRQPQIDMTISLSESDVSKELPPELAEMLATIAKSASVRTYTFPSLDELHLFQAALTGFNIVFDCLVSSFNISRRRMVVPIYKKWDASTTRVLLVQKDKAVQLAAFFENFNHGDSMNFTLKSTDVFESFTRNGKFSLRIVDAKFPMPRKHGEGGKEAEIENKFICLDEVDYPGEHDDITIVFDDEKGT